MTQIRSKKQLKSETKAQRTSDMKKTQITKAQPQVTTVPKNRWVKDARSVGCSMFYLKACLRFLANLCARHKGTFEDRDAFLPVAQIMTREKLLAMFMACTTDGIREDMKAREYGGIHDPKNEESKGLLRALWHHPQSNPKFRKQLAVWLDFALEKLSLCQTEHPDPVSLRFDGLKQLFCLSELEYDILVAVAVTNERNLLPCYDFRGAQSLEKTSKMSAMLGVTESEYLAAIKAKSKLRRYGCLDINGNINSDLLLFINGLDDTPLASRYFKRCETETLPWDYFGELSAKQGTFLKRLISARKTGNGVNILLYGEPGTGKTSFALALAAELGRMPYLIALTDDEQRGRRRAFRFSALQICDAQIDADKSLIIVDEADEMLGGTGSFIRMLLGESNQSVDKGVLNDILDNVKTPCVWIINSDAEALDSSNRRRFDYSIKFDNLTCEQRERIWGNAIARHKMGEVLSAPVLSRLAARYEVSAGGITLATDNLSAMLKDGMATPEEAETVIETILRPHCKLLNIDDGKDKFLVAADYSLMGLNIKGSITPNRITEAIRRYREDQRAGPLEGGIDRPRMNLLLSGPSGTGKTEFVKYLGTDLKMRVMTRMGGDLLNCYVGGTEQNIKRAFERAANENAILFLDEVDGLLQSRQNASRSWEVTQVNELLHQMENFKSVLICATNFINNLDTATLRRFTFKLEFDYLTDEGKVAFFKRMFAGFGVAGMTPEDELRLKRIPRLTPGDFRTVRQSLFYTGGDVTPSVLLEGLERESAAKRLGATASTIGFR